jgi:APA family basic amino acid/polyamine antiporter
MPNKNLPGLRLFDLTMIVIGLVIGMGIFRTSKDAALASLNPAIYFAAWIVGGLVALCGTLTYAEIGARYPVVGAYYKIFSLTCHPSLAFALNISILISNASSISAIALIGAGYVVPVFDADVQQWKVQAVAVGSILLFLFLNLKGLRLSSHAQNVLMSIKIVMLLVIIAAAFMPGLHVTSSGGIFARAANSWTDHLYSLGVALVAVSFTYGGYQQAINFGNEVRDARRTTPRGIALAILVILVLYLFVNISYYLVVGFDQMKQSTDIAAVVVQKMFGTTSAAVFSVFLFISVLGYVNVNLLSNPRVMYAMSEDGVLPKKFAQRNETSGVYPFSLIMYGLLSVLIVFFAETFERILSFSIFLDCFGFIGSGIALFVLRKRTRELDGKIFTVKGYSFVPVFFILSYVFVAVVIAISSPWMALTGALVLLGAAGLFFLGKRWA